MATSLKGSPNECMIYQALTYSSTNAEISAKMRSVVPEIDLLRGRPLIIMKKIKKIKEKHWKNI